MTEPTDDRMSVEEMIDSLTGHEEIAVEDQFQTDFLLLKGTKSVRALVFVHLMRTGLDGPQAKAAVLDMTMGQCGDYFADDDETDPAEPVTPAGKEG